MPAAVKSLLHLTEIIPDDSTWSMIGFGLGQLPMAMIAMTMDGHVRAGLEDNIYYSRGVLAKTNGKLVEKIVRISKEFGREVATPDEARKRACHVFRISLRRWAVLMFSLTDKATNDKLLIILRSKHIKCH